MKILVDVRVSCTHIAKLQSNMGASAKDPPLKLTSMLIGISLIKILVFYKIFFHGSGKIFCIFLSFFENLGRKKKKNQDFQDFCLFFSGSLEIFEIFEKSWKKKEKKGKKEKKR